MPNPEGLPRPRQQEEREKELPEWAIDIKTAFSAWENDYEAMKQELGKREGLIGDIHRKMFLEEAGVLYDGVHEIRELPETIPLDRGPQFRTVADVDTQTGSITFSKKHRPTEIRYYLPRTHELYTVAPFALTNEEKNSMYSPDGKNFVGIEEVKRRKKAGDKDLVFYDFYDLTPPSKKVLEDESRILSKNSEANWSERGEAENAQRNRIRYGLNPEQIGEVIKYLEDKITNEDDRAKLEKMKKGIDKTQATFPEVLGKAKQRFAGRIKQRIVNLTNILEERFAKVLPKSIDIGGKERENGEVKSSYFFLTREKKLVKVPYKKGLLSSEAKPDFSKAEDAQEEEWLNVGMLGSELLGIFPYETRKLIER